MLFVLDLDGTLIHTEDHRNDNQPSCGEVIEIRVPYGYRYLYICVRPTALLSIERIIDSGHEVAIWSFGDGDYVNGVVDILNQILALRTGIEYDDYTPPWKFIWSRDDIPIGYKDLSRVSDAYPEVRKDQIILIDNQQDQCDPNVSAGFIATLVPTFSMYDDTTSDIFPIIIEGMLYLYREK